MEFKRNILVTGGAGLVVLLIMVLVRRRMEGKPVVSLNFRTVAIALLGIVVEEPDSVEPLNRLLQKKKR